MSNQFDITDFQIPSGASRRASPAPANPRPLPAPVAPTALAIPGEIPFVATVSIETAPTTEAKDSEKLDLKQHRNRCAVCKHRDRAAIEDAFLRWCNVGSIVQDFQLPARDSVYRHAHAFGLFARRDANLRFALAHIIEEAESVPVNAHAVIDAVRAYAHIDGGGHWIEPPTTHIVLPGARLSSPAARPSRRRKVVRDNAGNQK